MEPYPNVRRSPRRKSMPAFVLEKNKENASPDRSSAIDSDMTLPIMKSSRQSLIPGRGILKATNYDDNNTVTGVFNLNPQSDAWSKRKKSLHRRVSFAPEAAVRRFDPERESNSPAREPKRKSALKKTAFSSPPKIATKSPSPTKPSPSPRKPATRSPRKASSSSPVKIIPQPEPEPRQKSPIRTSPRKGTPKKSVSPKKSPTPKKLPPQLASPSPATRTRSKSPVIGEESPSDMSMSISDDEADNAGEGSQGQNEKSGNDDEMLISFDSPVRQQLPARQLYPVEQKDSDSHLSFPSIFKTSVGPGMSEDREDGEDGEEDQSMEFTQVWSSGPGGREDEEGGDDGEMTMDLTTVQGVNGFASGNNEENDAEDEEQTMDMTRSFGGIEPDMEDEVSMDMTRPIGQEQADDDNEEEEDEQTMDVTRTFGAIVGESDHHEEEQTMDVTKAIGGIQPNQDEETMDVTRAFGSIQQVTDHRRIEEEEEEENDDDDDDDDEEEEDENAMDMTQTIGTIAEDDPQDDDLMEETQALGSIRGLKRSSPSKNESPSKRQKPSTPEKQKVHGLMLPPPSSQRTPSQSIRDGINSMSPRKSASVRKRTPKKISPLASSSTRTYLPEMELVSHTPLKSVKTWDQPVPSPSPMKNKLIQSLAPIEEYQDQDQDPEDQSSGAYQSYSDVRLTDFLNTINIDFMDDFLTSTRGHSSFGLTNEAVGEPKLVDYVVAGQKIAIFGVYDFSIREMRNNVKTAKEVFSQFEEDTIEENPLLFKEYYDASPDTKHIMNGQFKLMKTYAREQAKNVWYTWRTTLIKDVQKVLEKNLKNTTDDQSLLSRQKEAIEEEHSAISSKHAEMKRKLEAMRRRQAELANCDREALIKSQNNLAESKKQLSASQTRLEEQTNTVRLVRERVEEMLLKKRQTQEKIQAAEKIQQEHRSIENNEILELRSQFDLIQRCCGISRPRLDSKNNSLQFMVGQHLRLAIDIPNKRVSSEYCNVSNDGEKDIPLEFFHRELLQGIADGTQGSVSQQILRIKRRWQQALRISRDIKLLGLKHMTHLAIDEEKQQLTVKIRLHLPESKVYIKVQMNPSTVESYPQINGQVSMANVYGSEFSLSSASSKIEAQLQSQGISGVSEECTAILR